MMRGKLIVIEGLDGSGKGTQTELLYQAMAERGDKVRQVSFPDYESDSSALVRMYLRGDFGTRPEDVNPYAASAFYAVDRYAGYKGNWGAFYHAGGTILADRYTTSNAIYQCSKLPEDQWQAFCSWLTEFEYRQMGIPEPDKVIYLRTEVEVSQELMRGRYHGDEAKKDIHERNVQYLLRAQQAADFCADAMGWQVVRCSENGTMRSIEAIHQQLMELMD